ncbi:peroxin PEX13 SCDLUD_000211 [Saccharomycodes ludwigii]|uniref:peroxin PEX13 n=1 Tax=Saccharomycodes ludwigii TaxID=36035 RepID=UPI001E83709F|nr:hypothetical protein SCDLUD_000211 [Saccharomycodes ludwigii]KAH3902630.1 hypothetical protein SCDLUD_000211 [Saccharomycodes ludwigii]
MSSKIKPKPWEVNNVSSHIIDDAAKNMGTNPNSVQKKNDIDDNVNGEKIPPEPVARPDILEPTADIYGNSYGNNNSMLSHRNYGGGLYNNGLYGGAGMYGGVGGLYGSSMYGGGGLYGSGMYGGGLYGNNNVSGNGLMGEGTQSAFQLIEAMIYAITGFAQMLEATYMATHSSFFTMVSVAEQLSGLKDMAIGLINSGILDFIRITKKVLYMVSGGKLGKMTSSGNSKNLVDKNTSSKKKPKMSLKPLLMFLAIVIGFPYLLNKYISRMANKKVNYLASNEDQNTNVINPENLEFAKALYDFVPENSKFEAPLKTGELMAILSKKDAMGNDSSWWRVRTRGGKVGYVPNNYIQLLERKTDTNSVISKNDNKTEK